MSGPGIRFQKSPLMVPDDQAVKFGYPSDAAVVYDSASAELAVQTSDGAGALVDRIKVKAGASTVAIVLNEVGGNVYVGDSANGGMSQGLTINQGAFDTEVLALKSSDVAHGITTYAETDTFGHMLKVSGTSGGLVIRGLRSGGAAAMRLDGFGTTEDTAKSTVAVAPIALNAAKKSGTSVVSLAANGNIVVFQDNGTSRALIDVEGDLHLDGTSNPTA